MLLIIAPTCVIILPDEFDKIVLRTNFVVKVSGMEMITIPILW